MPENSQMQSQTNSKYCCYAQFILILGILSCNDDDDDDDSDDDDYDSCDEGVFDTVD